MGASIVCFEAFFLSLYLMSFTKAGTNMNMLCKSPEDIKLETSYRDTSITVHWAYSQIITCLLFCINNLLRPLFGVRIYASRILQSRKLIITASFRYLRAFSSLQHTLKMSNHSFSSLTPLNSFTPRNVSPTMRLNSLTQNQSWNKIWM